MILSLPLTGALLLSVVLCSKACVFSDVRACLRLERDGHRRTLQGQRALRGGSR